MVNYINCNSCLIVLPTYNEFENLERVYRRIRNVIYSDILVIDDGSTDGTLEVIKFLQNNDKKFNAMIRKTKKGLGDAYRTAYEFAIQNNYEVLIQCDADGSHEIEKIPLMVEAYQAGYDLVIGSRYVSGGSVAGWSKHRILISRIGNFYSRLVLGLKTKDNTAGFRLYKVALLRDLNSNIGNAKGYSFQVQMSYLCKNAKVKELPIKFVEREFGKSKMTFSIALEAFWQIPAIRTRKLSK